MKRILCLILCILLLAGITACGETYEDTNGEDDYSLQTITDDDIINLSTGSSGMTYKEESKELPVSTAEYHGENFNGVESIYRNNFAVSTDVNIYIGKMSVNSGNLRLCVLNEWDIIYDIPLDKDYDTYTFEDMGGEFSVHIAGESAEFEFFIDVYCAKNE